MRFLALFFCISLACCLSLTHGRAEEKGIPSLTEDATALGTLPKHGWVTVDKLTLQGWFVKGESKMRLQLVLKPDMEAIKKGKPIGKVTLAVDISKDGQAEVLVQPAEGTFELVETKEGRFLHITQKDVQNKNDVFDKKKVEKVEFKVLYKLADKKLTFPKGLDTDYWAQWTVKQKAEIEFQAK
jgi:hypothetical protein